MGSHLTLVHKGQGKGLRWHCWQTALAQVPTGPPAKLET